MGRLWMLAVVIGPILLALALAWAIWRNRRETGPGDIEQTERATKRLHEQIEEEDKARENPAAEP